ncbi:MAG: hypothetical protein LAT62_09855 [Natronospirillum sp.]|uniref:hypothetical protein n=1 Tax=Natronospirillum sp. TaxID=2812955 RepID=UPI0025DFADB4|nr:hypothetical protein [Natronospirillum sp.]MCH8552229.1 hypothetical protein [Natronospirillum sp.]
MCTSTVMRSIVLLGTLVVLAACSSQELQTSQESELQWRTQHDALPPASDRFRLDDPLPAGTLVSVRAPRLDLDVESDVTERRIERRRLYIDSNGLPLIEMPESPTETAELVQGAMEDLEWRVRRVRMAESRVEIDGSEWLQRSSGQLFPRRPVIYVYFYALGSGTQVHLERRDSDQPFPVGTQRELLEKLYAELS